MNRGAGFDELTALPPKVQEQLGWYVYLYIDPRDDTPFYVGKGKGNRCFAHLKDKSGSPKCERIEELKKLGTAPKIELLKWDLAEKQALLVEQTAIDLLGIENLTNLAKGHGSKNGSRGPIEEIAQVLCPEEAKIVHPCILIKIAKDYRMGMDTHEIYEATRSAWRVGAQAQRVDFALSIHGGIIREVFTVSAWLPAGSTLRRRTTREENPNRDGRMEFVGTIAPVEIRRRYKGRSVAHLYTAASQNPIRYAGLDPV